MSSLSDRCGEERYHHCAMEETDPILQREGDRIVMKLAAMTQQPQTRQEKKNDDGETPEHVGMPVETGRESVIDQIDHHYEHCRHHRRNTDRQYERRVAGA